MPNTPPFVPLAPRPVGLPTPPFAPAAPSGASTNGSAAPAPTGPDGMPPVLVPFVPGASGAWSVAAPPPVFAPSVPAAPSAGDEAVESAAPVVPIESLAPDDAPRSPAGDAGVTTVSHAADDAVVPIESLAPDAHPDAAVEPVVPIESLAPDEDDGGVVPIEVLAPDTASEFAASSAAPPAAQDSGAADDPVLPGWESWEASAAEHGERVHAGASSGEDAAERAGSPPPAPDAEESEPRAAAVEAIPTDVFGFPDIPDDYELAAARGVADPAAWPSDAEWGEGSAERDHDEGVATAFTEATEVESAREEEADAVHQLERSQAGAIAWGAIERMRDEPASAPHVAAADPGSLRTAEVLEALAERLRGGALVLAQPPRSGAAAAVHLAAVLQAVLGEEVPKS